jgi:Mn2+/Fe2+ NRAMP family transporter
MKADVAVGMFFSQLIMWAIMVTAAGGLHTHGITDIQSSEQAAKALEPVVKSFPYSGQISKLIFCIWNNWHWNVGGACVGRILNIRSV